MKALLERLEKNIEAEIEVQTGVQKLLDQQLDILLRGKTNRLSAVLANAEAALGESGRLEQERAGLVAEVAGALGLPIKEVSLKLLEERCGELAAGLGDKGGELRLLLERIRDRNRQVGLLLRHSVLFIEDLVRIVAGGGGVATTTYTRHGALQAKSQGTVVAEA